MTSIFLVVGSWGEYEQARDEPMRAFASRARAEAYMAIVKSRDEELERRYNLPKGAPGWIDTARLLDEQPENIPDPTYFAGVFGGGSFDIVEVEFEP